MNRESADRAVLRPLAEPDVDAVIALGRAIWLTHYVPLIGRAQVDYMTGQRFTPSALRRYLDAEDRWLDVLWLRETPVGFCSYALGKNSGELKLEQLYLSHAHHGRGLGGLMLRHVESRARDLRRAVIMLTVNKHNAGSIAVYLKSGFTVREEAVFDIGGGYVMDDYVMEKSIA